MPQTNKKISVPAIAELLYLRHAIVFDNLSPNEAHAGWELCNKDFWEKQVLTVLEVMGE